MTPLAHTDHLNNVQPYSARYTLEMTNVDHILTLSSIAGFHKFTGSDLGLLLLWTQKQPPTFADLRRPSLFLSDGQDDITIFMMKDKLLLAWSGGKDSAFALYELKHKEDVEIAALLTTVTEGDDRISMHGVRRKLLAEQAKAVGYPLEEVAIPQICPNDIYEQRMREALEKYHRKGTQSTAFGDLFLEDVRAYREERMSRIGMRCVFPLWGRPTVELAGQFIDLGFRAIVVCVDTKTLSPEFSGREYDRDLLRDLPAGVDPCAENGEFHTFVYDGPIFSWPVSVQRGEKVLRDDRFYYCDLA
jgi:uncharacterized protein (TIGR00290 family)